MDGRRNTSVKTVIRYLKPESIYIYEGEIFQYEF